MLLLCPSKINRRYFLILGQKVKFYDTHDEINISVCMALKKLLESIIKNTN